MVIGKHKGYNAAQYKNEKHDSVAESLEQCEIRVCLHGFLQVTKGWEYGNTSP